MLLTSLINIMKILQ